MTKTEKNKQLKQELAQRRAEYARKEAEAIETFRSLNIKAGDFIQVSYISKLYGKNELKTETWFADPCEHNHYDRNLPFLKKLSFWNLSGGYQLLTYVGEFFDIKKIESTPELLERVQNSKDISNSIYASYNSGGQYKGD